MLLTNGILRAHLPSPAFFVACFSSDLFGNKLYMKKRCHTKIAKKKNEKIIRKEIAVEIKKRI